MDALESRLARCFLAVFPDLNPEHVRTASVDTVGSWDSVATVTLLDVVEGEFCHVELTAGTHREAERLVLATATDNGVGLRAGDALHLAAAVISGARTLITFDRRMSVAARAMGTFDVPA